MTKGSSRFSPGNDDPLIPEPSGILRGLTAILLVFLTVKVVFLVVLAVNTAFIMDEYTHFADARLSLANVYQTVWPPKTLLYAAFFGIAHWFADGAVQLMLVARVQSAAVAMASLGLLYLIARQLGRGRAGHQEEPQQHNAAKCRDPPPKQALSPHTTAAAARTTPGSTGRVPQVTKFLIKSKTSS